MIIICYNLVQDSPTLRLNEINNIKNSSQKQKQQQYV
jgi:hypothetical protein